MDVVICMYQQLQGKHTFPPKEERIEAIYRYLPIPVGCERGAKKQCIITSTKVHNCSNTFARMNCFDTPNSSKYINTENNLRKYLSMYAPGPAHTMGSLTKKKKKVYKEIENKRVCEIHATCFSIGHLKGFLQSKYQPKNPLLAQLFKVNPNFTLMGSC